MASLQRRLDLGLIISLIACFALQWPIVNTFIRAQTEGHTLSRLQKDSEVLLSALHSSKPELALTLDPTHIDASYKRPFSGRYFQISFNDTILRSRSLWDEELPQVSLQKRQTQISREDGPNGQSLLIHNRSYQKQTQVILISVAEDLSTLEAGIATFQRRYATLSVVVLILLIFIQLRIVRGSYHAASGSSEGSL